MAILQTASISNELDVLKKSILKGEGAAPYGDEEKECFLITYSFSKKSRSKKMLINYELAGRNGKEGLLGMLNGKKVTSGCIIIPADKQEEIEIFLNRHELEYSVQKIMLLG